jgi:hypothetical protein
MFAALILIDRSMTNYSAGVSGNGKRMKSKMAAKYRDKRTFITTFLEQYPSYDIFPTHLIFHLKQPSTKIRIQKFLCQIQRACWVCAKKMKSTLSVCLKFFGPRVQVQVQVQVQVSKLRKFIHMQSRVSNFCQKNYSKQNDTDDHFHKNSASFAEFKRHRIVFRFVQNSICLFWVTK